MDWLSIAKQLPTGQKTRTDCPECGAGTNTNAAIVNHQPKVYSLYCNACGHNPHVDKGIMTLSEIKALRELNEAAERYSDWDVRLPADAGKTPIPIEGRLWLYLSGITETQISKYRICYSESLRRVILPVYSDDGELVWYQARAIFAGQKPKYIQPSKDKGSVLFSAQGGNASDTTVTVTEDILSAIRVGESNHNCYSILGTKLSTGQLNRLAKFTRVNVWLDGDAAGRRSSTLVRKSLSLVTDAVSIRTRRDPKKYSNREIRAILGGIADTDAEGYVP